MEPIAILGAITPTAVLVAAGILGLIIVLIAARLVQTSVAESGHQAGRAYFDQSGGNLHLNGALLYMDETGNALNPVSFTAMPRNFLDGGDMTTNPFQRNIPGLASAGVISVAITNTPTYFADRWFGVGAGTSAIIFSVVADTNVVGFSQSLTFGRQSANADVNVINMGQVVETADTIRAQGQTVCFSFWIRTGANYSGGAVTVKLFTGTGTNQSAANMSAGSWTNSATPINTTFTPTGTMTRVFFTGVVPTNATQMGVQLSYTPTGTAGANDNIIVNGFQLELGSTPSPYEHTDIQVVTEICQRYAWVIPEPASGVQVGTGSCPTTTTATIYMATPVQMLKAPTLSVTTGSFNVRPANAAASGTAAAGTTHTPNAITISVTSVTATTAGFGTPLLGGGGAGFIVASADF